MSDIYNPETVIFEKLEALTVEARRLKHLGEQATDANDRKTLDRQRHEVEQQIEQLKRKIRA